MKKTILIIIFYLAVGQVSAQIRVNSDGNVGIDRNPSYKLDVNISGTNKASFSSWFNTYIDQSGLYGSTSIYPEVDWYLQLGYWDHQIGNIFTYGMHTNNIWWDSDSTFKKILGKLRTRL